MGKYKISKHESRRKKSSFSEVSKLPAREHILVRTKSTEYEVNGLPLYRPIITWDDNMCVQRSSTPCMKTTPILIL